MESIKYSKKSNKDLAGAPFLKEFCRTASNMYRLGWDERNGGNISMIVEEEQIEGYIDLNEVKRNISLGFNARELAGKIFLVTGTGRYFKNVEGDPGDNLGLVRISADGQAGELLWGFEDGGRPTSEFPAHLMSHMQRLKQDSEHKVVLHSHPTYTIAMNAVCPIDEKDFTHKLWQSNTEAIVVFPDGVGVLPCMVCGTNEIGEATAEKMKEYRLVMWTNHGIYGTGKDLDEAFGLVETVEKTAQIYMLAHSVKSDVHVIPDSILKALAERFSVTPKAGILNI